MRPLSLWRHEVRRAGPAALLTPPVVALVVVAIAVDSAVRLHDPGPNTALILQNLLELGLPLAAGVGAASLVGRDPAVELQLTLPTAYRATILRRLTASTGWVAAIAVTVVLGVVATGWWDRWPGAHTPLAGQLTWLAPTAFVAGLGLLVGAVAGSSALAVSVVAMVWTLHLAATGPFQNHQWSRQLYLFATTRGGPELDWTANRLTLLAEDPVAAGSVLSLTVDYPLKVFFDSATASAGPHPGAALNFLRPQPTVATAVLSVALMVGLAAAILAAAGCLYARKSE